MGQRIRVMIADDSAVVRRLVAEALHSEPEFEVYPAVHGRDAIDQISRVRPDVVVLDFEMPIMGGVEAVRAIREIDHRLPIIMFCSPANANCEALLEAMGEGANDYVTKAIRLGHVADAVRHIRSQLAPKIRHLTEQCVTTTVRVDSRANKDVDLRMASAAPVEVVVIGTSSSGPNELALLLSQLPIDLPVPVLIAHHMPPALTQLLVQRLDEVSPLPVAEAIDNRHLLPGEVWLAPGGCYLGIDGNAGPHCLSVSSGPPEGSYRPFIDSLFRSAVQHHRAQVLGIILSGLGPDGVAGSRAIQEAGGHVIVQRPDSWTHNGMQRIVTEEGLADCIMPIEEIADAIVGLTAHHSASGPRKRDEAWRTPVEGGPVSVG